MANDYAIRSDFLVHWTGCDLDKRYQPDWRNDEGSIVESDTELCQKYLERLHNTLKFGLWLTQESKPEVYSVGGNKYEVPITPRTCFTELKLSQSRVHAGRYGRLGIGVKRAYLFARLGRPLTYFWLDGMKPDDMLLRSCATEAADKRLLNFFKPMAKRSKRYLEYDMYYESEWRILFFDQLLEKRLLIDPRDPKNSAEHEYFLSLTTGEQEKLRYLAPLDGWFQVIIYPSVKVKNAAQQDTSQKIYKEIARIKGDPNDHGNSVEKGNWPMEIDLDACRNF